jgi:lipoprotein NlpI
MSGVQLPLSGLPLGDDEDAKLASRPAWERAALYDQLGLSLLARSEIEAKVRARIAAEFKGVLRR